MTRKGLIRVPAGRRLPLVVATGAALGVWALAAAHGHAWQMTWLPATVAGAAWAPSRKRTLDRCLSRLSRGCARSEAS